MLFLVFLRKTLLCLRDGASVFSPPEGIDFGAPYVL